MAVAIQLNAHIEVVFYLKKISHSSRLKTSTNKDLFCKDFTLLSIIPPNTPKSESVKLNGKSPLMTRYLFLLTQDFCLAKFYLTPLFHLHGS